MNIGSKVKAHCIMIFNLLCTASNDIYLAVQIYCTCLFIRRYNRCSRPVHTVLEGTHFSTRSSTQDLPSSTTQNRTLRYDRAISVLFVLVHVQVYVHTVHVDGLILVYVLLMGSSWVWITQLKWKCKRFDSSSIYIKRIILTLHCRVLFTFLPEPKT